MAFKSWLKSVLSSSEEASKKSGTTDELNVLYRDTAHVEHARRGSDLQSEELDIRQLPATYVPDIIIRLAQQGKANVFPYARSTLCVAFFTDVSGFTIVTQRYTRKGTNGLEALMKTISNYIGSLVALILNFGGDVIKFAGDSFLSLWPTSEEEDLPNLLKNAIACAIKMQTEWAEWPTAVDYTLHIKIGIATGACTINLMGIPDVFAQFAITGKVIDDVRLAEHLCQAGDIILSTKAWELLSTSFSSVSYRYSMLPNNFVKLLIDHLKTRTTTPAERGVKTQTRIKAHRKTLIGNQDEVLHAIRLYLMPQVKAEEGDTFPELRPVTNVFLSLPDINSEQVYNLHNIIQHIYLSIKNIGGVINKVMFFDKGCTVLVVFGLPGLKQTNDSTEALRCSGKIIGHLKQLSMQCSIGITTGTCFCGSVGHPQRQEYTVFGTKVNMAARLMMAYPESPIVCDADTYYMAHVDLHDSNFTLLPNRGLKGIDEPGNVYEYNWKAVRAQTEDFPTPVTPMIGMVQEKRFVWTRLKYKQMAHRLDIKLKPDELVSVFVGPSGCGKSRLLIWCMELAKELGYKTAGCVIKMTMKGAKFATLRHLLYQLLGITDTMDSSEKQALIREKLLEESKQTSLHYLNEAFDIEFPEVKKAEGSLGVAHAEKQRNILISRMIANCGEDVLFCISNAHFMDETSCKVLELSIRSGHLVCFLGLPFQRHQEYRDRHPCVEWVTKISATMISIGPLLTYYHGSFACQRLNVAAVHNEIVSLLNRHGHENPMWIAALLDYMVELKMVAIYPLSHFTSKKRELYHDPNVMGTKQATQQPPKIKSPLADKEEESADELKACILVADQGFRDFKIPNSVTEMILQRIDTLHPDHRVFLIKAAILGESFEKDTFMRIHPTKTEDEIVNWIRQMKQLGIMQCGVKLSQKGTSLAAVAASHTLISESSVLLEAGDTHIECICSKLDVSFPGNCLRPQFRVPAIIQTLKELLTAETSQSMHQDIAENLEASLQFKPVVCNSCRRVMMEQAEESSDTTRGHSLLPTEMQKSPNYGFEMVKTVDCRACRCLQMKTSTYQTMGHQWEFLGCPGKAVHYMMQAAQAALSMEANENAWSLVEKASMLLDAYVSNVAENKKDIQLDQKIHRACCERLFAMAILPKSAREALTHISSARSTLGGLAESLNPLHLKKLIDKVHNDRKVWPEALEVAKCLEAAVEINLALGNEETAADMAICYFRLMDKLKPDFLQMVQAYTTFIKGNYYNLKHSYKVRQHLESEAIQCCINRLKMTSEFSTEELQAITRLYNTIFMQRLKMRAVVEAAEIGMESYDIAHKLRDNMLLLQILPPLAVTFLFLKSGEQCIQILRVLKSTAQEVKNTEGMALYYAMMSDVVILEKHQVKGDLIQDCRSFSQSECKIFTGKEDIDLYLTASMAHWSVFHGISEDKQLYWREMAQDYADSCTKRTLWSLAGQLSLLSCKILLMTKSEFLSSEEIISEKDEIQKRLEHMMMVEIRPFPVFVSRINDMLLAAEAACQNQLEMIIRE